MVVGNEQGNEQKNENIYRVGGSKHEIKYPNEPANICQQKKDIEPWLSAIFQSEHLALLLGNGFTTAVALQSGAEPVSMKYKNFSSLEVSSQKKLKSAAKKIAKTAGRDVPNIEDQIRIANDLLFLQSLKIMDGEELSKSKLKSALSDLFKDFVKEIFTAEKKIRKAVESEKEIKNTVESKKSTEEPDPLVMLVSFLLSFASRTATRERLNIFTTNYDRLIEYGADLAGLRLLDRFVGSLEPIFRSSRLDIDMHYNPPGIRGEPRYLEGVAKLTKLHGSLDWSYRNGFVRKIALPFGSEKGHQVLRDNSAESVMIYPNAAKDRETAEYPYVELFRDYAAAVCRPNSALVTYGYGFGDEHINRTIADMLTIPSTHLVIISYVDSGSRVHRFCEKVGREAQISLLLGEHFGSMPNLVKYYLPKPAIDRITIRQTELLRNRNLDGVASTEEAPAKASGQEEKEKTASLEEGSKPSPSGGNAEPLPAEEGTASSPSGEKQ